MSLEDGIRDALRREPAPPGFAERVFARTTAKARAPRRHLAFALAAALALAAIAPPAVFEYRRRRAEEARDQLRLAISITRVQLQAAREKLYTNSRSKL